jgi:hypothetical protein
MQAIITAIAVKHQLPLDRVGASMRLDQPGYQRLCIEVIGRNQISVAHYADINGDLVHDPEIVFFTDPRTQQWLPIAIGQVFGGWRETARLMRDASAVLAFEPYRQADIADFAESTWAPNLRAQGWIDVATPTRIDRAEPDPTDEQRLAA